MTTLNWNLSGPLGHLTPSGSRTQHKDLYDGVVGVRGRYTFGDSKWFVPYYVDVGTGSSSLTWQGSLGLGYAAGWGDVKLAYRHLYYRQSGNKLLHDFSISGPTLSATFRF